MSPAQGMAVGTQVRTVELLAAFATAGELGRGQPAGHLARVSWISQAIGREMGLQGGSLADLHAISLLAHTGCTAGASDFAAFLMGDELVAAHNSFVCDPDNKRQVLRWLARHTAPGRSRPVRAGLFARALLQAEGTMGELESGCSDVGGRIAERLDMPGSVVSGVHNICETWGGKGPRKLRGDASPVAARIVHAAIAFEVLITEVGLENAVESAERRAGRSLDPEVVAAFKRATAPPSFLADLDREATWEWALTAYPDDATGTEDAAERTALAFADFSDLKSRGFAAHSRATAELAERMARRLRLSAADIELTRRAGLVHAVGHSGIPAALIRSSTPLSLADEERLRLHPLLTERIVERVAALARAGEIASMHHERLDGGGYPRRLSGAGIPLPARILAVADAYREEAERTSDPADVGRLLASVRRDAGPGFDPDCVAALEAELTGGPARHVRRAPWPRALSDREVEVLRLLGKGLKGKEVARALVVSESTARHHIEHIYNKLGVSSRAGAILFAVENQLIA